MGTVRFCRFCTDLPPRGSILPSTCYLRLGSWGLLGTTLMLVLLLQLHYIFNNISFLQLFRFMKSWFWPYATSEHSSSHGLTSALHTIFHSSGSYFINSLFQFTIPPCVEVPLIFLPDVKKRYKMATFFLQAGPRTFLLGFPIAPCIDTLQSVHNLSLAFSLKVHSSAANIPGCALSSLLGLAEVASSKSKLYGTNCQFTVNALGRNISFSYSNWHQLQHCLKADQFRGCLNNLSFQPYTIVILLNFNASSLLQTNTEMYLWKIWVGLWISSGISPRRWER